MRASREAAAIRPGRKFVRTLDQSGEGGAFRQRHLARRLVEVTARGRLRAVESSAEINPVEIQLHDFLLGEIVLDPAGDEHFEQLAAKGFAFEIEAVPRQLLGDRARPLANVAGDGVLERGPDNSQQIVAVVLIKFVVLHRDDGVDEIGRELVVGNGLAILDVDLAKDLVVPIDDHAGRFHLLEMREIERGRLLPEARRRWE